jgi:Dimerisation domain
MADSAATSTTTPRSLPAELRSLIEGYWITQAVYVATKLGVADLLKDGPQPAAALAKATGAHALSLTRLLRFLASVGVFT